MRWDDDKPFTTIDKALMAMVVIASIPPLAFCITYWVQIIANFIG